MELTIFSLVPPALALLLVIITKRVISLGAGIIVGSLMLNDYNPLSAAAQVYSILMSIIFDYDLAGNAVTIGSVTTAVYLSWIFREYMGIIHYYFSVATRNHGGINYSLRWKLRIW